MFRDVNDRSLDFLVQTGLLDFKSFRRTVGRLGRGITPGGGGKRGRTGRRVVLNARFDPNARDGDNDGIVQEMTRWERPATPRMNMRPTTGGDGETDIEAYLQELQTGRRRDIPQRLMGGPDLGDAPKPRRDARGRDRLGLDRPRADVTDETYRGPRTIIPAVPGKPMTTVIKGMSKKDWDEMVDDLTSYFADSKLEMDPKDKKLKALYQLMDAVKKVKVKDSEDGLELDGTDEYFKRIGKSLRAIKNQGNDNIRNLEIVRDAMKATRTQKPSSGSGMLSNARDTSLRILNFNSPFFKSVRQRDAQIAVDTIKAITEDIESKYGVVTTKKQAIDALNKAHPNIVRNFKFLYDKNTPDELTSVQRGLVYGYLQVLGSSDTLQKYNLQFSRMDGEQKGGGATKFGFAWLERNDKGDTFGKTQTIFDFSDASSDALIQGNAYSQKMDGLPNQISLAYMRANPDNLSDQELVDMGGFIDSALTAVHEGGHAHNILKAMEVVFGEDALKDNPDKFRKIIADMLADPKTKRDLIRPQVNNFAYELLNTVHRIDALNMYKNEINDFVDALATHEALSRGIRNIGQFKTQNADALWAVAVNQLDQLAETYHAYSTGAIDINRLASMYPELRQNPSLFISTMERAYIVRSHVIQRIIPEEAALIKKRNNLDFRGSFDLYGSILEDATRSEANLNSFIDAEKLKHEKIIALFNSPKYKDLNDELQQIFDNERTNWFTAWARTSTRTQAESSIKKRLKHERDRNKILMRLLRDKPDKFEEFSRDLMEALYGPGSSDRFDRVTSYDDPSIIYSAIRTKITDDLTEDERSAFKDWTKTLSDYGSLTVHSFYKNQQEGAPVEGIAETSAALIAGILPEPNTPQWDAVRKLTIWNYGIDFWNKVVRKRNE